MEARIQTPWWLSQAEDLQCKYCITWLYSTPEASDEGSTPESERRPFQFLASSNSILMVIITTQSLIFLCIITSYNLYKFYWEMFLKYLWVLKVSREVRFYEHFQRITCKKKIVMSRCLSNFVGSSVFWYNALKNNE